MPIITAQADLPKTVPTETIQPDKVETPVQEATKQDVLSPQYAAIARKEKALRAEAQRLKQEREAMTAEKAKTASDYVSKADIQKRFADNPMAAMTEFGLTYDQLTQLALNPPSQESQKIQQLEAKLAELEGRQTKTLTTLEQQQNQAYEQAVNQIRNDAKVLIERDSNFETIKETSSVEDVVDLIKEVFEKGWEEKGFPKGHVLDIDKAATFVEEYLVEDALKKAKLKKVAAKLAPPPAPVEVAPKQSIPSKQQIIPRTQELKTLTNTVSVSSKPLSERDRVQRAILAFQGQLNT